ncbi:hypothetical protein [Halomonas sp. H2]|uniref:hypothetical protein n=1 Tax=Halomonas sp. H2 TaxID=261936 RepID=UPI003CF7ED08
MGEVGREIIDAPNREDIWAAAVQVMGEVQARRWIKTAHSKLDGKSPTRCIEEDPMRIYDLVALERANG